MGRNQPFFQTSRVEGLLANKPTWRAYVLAIILSFLAIAVRRWLDTFGDGVLLFAIFYPVILICTLFGGIGAGTISVLIAVLAALTFWLPSGTVSNLSVIGLLNLSLFVLASISIIAVAVFLRSTIRHRLLSEARLAATFESVPAAIAAIDQAGEVLLANQRYIGILPSRTSLSRDSEQALRWRGWDNEGFPLSPDNFPNAKALRGEAVLPGQDMILTDDDGHENWLRVATVPTRNAEGRLDGMITVLTDIAQSKATEAALRETQARLQTLIDGIPQMVWRAAPDGGWTWVSSQWEQVTGQSFAASSGDGWLDMLHPDDRYSAQEAWSDATTTLSLNFYCRLHDEATGSYQWYQVRALPVQNSDGTISEWLGTCTDIHELRELQERQVLLVGELQHRTRNLIGVIRAMCHMTARGCHDYNEFKTKYLVRLDALGRVQGLLSRLTPEDRVTFDELLEAELTAFRGDESANKVTLSGPRGVRLRSSAVQTLAMALHELTTNALKYGALSQERASLKVAWMLEQSADARTNQTEEWLRIDWSETGVRMQAGGNGKCGHGRELIERALPFQLGARTNFELGPDGVNCTIWIEVSKHQATGGLEHV